MDFLYGAAGGGVVGIIAVIFGIFAIGYIRRIIDERDALKNTRMAKLEDRLECHIRDDQSHEALLPVMKSVLSVFQDWANKIADMSADGSLITWFGRIAESGVSAIGEIIKWSITLTNHFAAAFRTIGAWGEVLWNGLKTGLLGLITLWVAQIEAMVNAAVAAYNTVVRFFGGQGKEISWTWTRATGETTAESARATADAYRRATDGGYFAEAMQDNQAWDRKIDSAVGRINEQIGKSVSSCKINKKADKTKRGKSNPAAFFIYLISQLANWIFCDVLYCRRLLWKYYKHLKR